MLEELKERIYKANLEIVKRGLVIYTWGNVSGMDRDNNLIVIKPSGVAYESMSWSDMVVVDLQGNVVEGKYKPSTDMETHLVLYKAFPEISGIVHTHSVWGSIFAQAGMDIPVLGTTHADYFYGNIPCTREMTAQEVSCNYEVNTGKVIVDSFSEKNYMEIPGVLVKSHGPFVWGTTPELAVHNAVVLDKIAEMAYKTMMINKNCPPIHQYLLDRHYLRKHGSNASYGQNEG